MIYFIAISDFRDASACLENVCNAFVCEALSSDNRMVCYRRKAFLKLSFILMYYTYIFMYVEY